MADSSEMFDRVCLFVLSVSPGSRPILNKNIKYLLLILKKQKRRILKQENPRTARLGYLFYFIFLVRFLKRRKVIGLKQFIENRMHTPKLPHLIPFFFFFSFFFP